MKKRRYSTRSDVKRKKLVKRRDGIKYGSFDKSRLYNNNINSSRMRQDDKREKVGFFGFIKKMFNFQLGGPINYDDYRKEVLSGDDVTGLEKFQVRLTRIWNGNLGELVLVFVRILLVIGFIAAFIIGGRLIAGVPDVFAPFGTY